MNEKVSAHSFMGDDKRKQGRPSLLRLIFSFFMAPAIPILFGYTGMILSGMKWEAESAAISIAILSYLFTLIVGVPSYVVLRRKNINTFKAYVTFGALMGGLCYALVLMYLLPKVRFPFFVFQNTVGLLGLAVACSTLASCVFWLTAIKNA